MKRKHRYACIWAFQKKEFVNFYTCSLEIIEGSLDDVYDWRGDILSKQWRPELALKKLKASPSETMICDALLDQDIFAGLGNIIKNEVLFRTKVQPESLVHKLPLKKRKELVRESVKYVHEFLEWKQAGTLARHWEAYSKKTCPRDGEKLLKANTGKGKRRSFWCGECMKLYH